MVFLVVFMHSALRCFFYMKGDLEIKWFEFIDANVVTSSADCHHVVPVHADGDAPNQRWDFSCPLLE